MKTFRDLKVGLDEDLNEKLAWLVPNYQSIRIRRKSVDARRSTDVHWVYSVDVFEQGETAPVEKIVLDRVSRSLSTSSAGKSSTGTPSGSFDRPVVVGSGPAGLFAALRLVERGLSCVLLERGSQGATRIQKINRFWRYGELDPDNNVCFGEGGAGLYSDGKLITRIKSPHIPYVIDRLIQFGAPEEIRFLSNPHVGSDRIRRVIPKMREFLLANGCEVHFDTTVTSLVIDENSKRPHVVGVKTLDGREFRSNHVVLATGHSAEDVFVKLAEQNVALEGKSFALGLRVEHPQTLINSIQYRGHADHPSLGAANYRLADHDSESGIGVYSFCMCPGGYVLSSGTENGHLVSNGMSNYHRNSPFANAAIVVSIDHDKRFGDDVWGGMQFRRSLESLAYKRVVEAGGTRELPAQRVTDFMQSKLTDTVASSSPSGVRGVRLDQVLPDDIVERLRSSLETFNQQMRGFISSDAQLHGVESRTSCPIRITRDAKTYESISHAGLFPAGEGAGYAGGITSAACDGVRIADVIANQLSSTALLDTEAALARGV
jgi:uncharacterized FAD-dependent dehydrogenase